MCQVIEDIGKMLGEIHNETKKIFEKSGIEYSEADIYELACEKLQETLTQADPDSEWEVTVVYDSMEELYKKTLI